MIACPVCNENLNAAGALATLFDAPVVAVAHHMKNHGLRLAQPFHFTFGGKKRVLRALKLPLHVPLPGTQLLWTTDAGIEALIKAQSVWCYLKNGTSVVDALSGQNGAYTNTSFVCFLNAIERHPTLLAELDAARRLGASPEQLATMIET